MKFQNTNMFRITSLCLTILFLGLMSSSVTYAETYKSNVVSANYQYQAWGQYPLINLFGEKDVPLFNNEPLWKCHVNKLAKLVTDSKGYYNLKTGDKLDLGQGYSLTAKQVDVVGKKVWLGFDKDGTYVDDTIIYTDSGDAAKTWTCKIDKLQGEDNVVVLKVHVNQIYQGAVDSFVQIDGLWLIDYQNTIKLDIGDEFGSYTLIAINSGVDASNLGSLVFNGQQIPPVPAFSATPTTGSAPLTITFSDQSTGTPTSWLWKFGDGNTSTDKSPMHTYSNIGKYTVNLTVKNAAGSNTVTKSNYITVTPPVPPKPVAAFSASLTSGKKPLTVKFTDKSTGSPTSWLWDFGDKTTSTVKNPVHKYTKAGKYTVSLTVKNAAGSNTKKISNYIIVK